MGAQFPFITQECGAFYRAWYALPRGHLLPHTRTFLDQAPAGLMPLAQVFEREDAGFRIRLMGTRLVDFWQLDRTGGFLGDNLEPDQRRQLERIADAAVETPCGFWQLGDMQSTKGRALGFEAITLPLGVDPGKPARLVTCIALLDPPGHNEYGACFIPIARREWIDIGRGTPPTALP
jgi:hypothetical protein